MTKKNMTIVFVSSLVFITSIFLVVALNLMQLIFIIKAEQRVGFIKLLKHENMRTEVLDVLYSGAFADHCTLNHAREMWVFKYTLETQFSYAIESIEDTFNGILQEQHTNKPMTCPYS